MNGYPKWFQPWIIHATTLILFLSGVLLIPTALELRLDWQVPWRLAAEHRVSTAALHAAFALVIFWIIGALSMVHMRLGWRKKKNVQNGIIQLVVWAFLGASGLGIYYFGDENWSRSSSVAHTVAGLAIGLLYLWHIFAYTNVRAKK